MKKFDVSIPRKMYWSDELDNKDFCPECNSKLEHGSSAYLLMIRQKQKYEPLTTLNDGGYFCPDCPVVVLDTET